MPPFRWTGRREEAALLIAEDRLTNIEIAAKVGVTRQSIREWKQYPEFMARVDSHVAAMSDAVRERGIANRERRVAALHDRWRRMLRLMEDRAAEMVGVPGGETGLLVKQIKAVKVKGRGPAGRAGTQLALWDPEEGDGALADGGTVEVAEYVVDGTLLKELREHEKQAAIEMGQWEQAETPPDDRLALLADEVLLELQAEDADPATYALRLNPGHDTDDPA